MINKVGTIVYCLVVNNLPPYQTLSFNRSTVGTGRQSGKGLESQVSFTQSVIVQCTRDCLQETTRISTRMNTIETMRMLPCTPPMRVKADK